MRGKNMEPAKKQLSDYPDFVRVDAAVKALQSENTEVSSRLEEISVELSEPKRAEIVDGEELWTAALAGKDVEPAADVRSGLREEQLRLEERIRRLDEALGFGRMELD